MLLHYDTEGTVLALESRYRLARFPQPLARVHQCVVAAGVVLDDRGERGVHDAIHRTRSPAMPVTITAARKIAMTTHVASVGQKWGEDVFAA